jgi:hypothetical protein
LDGASVPKKKVFNIGTRVQALHLYGPIVEKDFLKPFD